MRPLLFPFALTLLTASAWAEEPPIKRYTIKRTTVAIEVDGRYDESAWESAEIGELGDPRDGRPASLKTRFRMLYDDQMLYVAFEAEDEIVFSPSQKHDDPVFAGDALELFLITGDDPHYYYEIDTAPTGDVWDAVIVNTMGWETAGGKHMLNKQPLTNFNVEGMQTAVTIEGGQLRTEKDGRETASGWNLEMAIPLAQLPGGKTGPPQSGTVWRGNLYRIEKLDPTKKKVELQAFSPVLSLSFSTPKRFAYLTFE